MILRLSLDLPEDVTYIRTTRLLSRCLLQDIKVRLDIIRDVEMIVTELCSNVVHHAQSKDTHFLITLEYSKPQVVITVKDTGRGFSLRGRTACRHSPPRRRGWRALRRLRSGASGRAV